MPPKKTMKAKATQAKKPVVKSRPVLLATNDNGSRSILFGYAEETNGDRVHLKRARMAIYWGTTKGVMQLAETGPTSSSKISARADLEARNVVCVMEVSEAAAKAWEVFP